jgi:hypothetical protein
MKAMMKHASWVALVLMAATCIARADTIYTSQAAWAAAVSGYTAVTFNAAAPNPNNSYYYPSGYTVGGLSFTGSPPDPYNSIYGLGANFLHLGVSTIAVEGHGIGDTDLLITLPGTTALGLDFDVWPGTLTITLSDGTTQTIVAAGTPTVDFFGVTSTADITSVNFDEPYNPGINGVVAVSEFDYVPADPAGGVPEPNSLLLVFTGLAGCAGVLRSRLLRRC